MDKDDGRAFAGRQPFAVDRRDSLDRGAAEATSLACTRPCGPDPEIFAMSTPPSRARRRAFGVARDPSATAASAEGKGAAVSGAASRAFAMGAGFGAKTSSAPQIQPITAPTRTSSPGRAATPRKMPLAGA